jgi:signal peptidase I
MKRGVHAAAWVALVVAAFVLWPQRWGGTMTYDITHGTSMQPTFHTGDLAVLRKSSRYDVGDVAAYRSPSLHTTVMHRIKTKTAKGYTFKGDNNDFVDPDTVTDDELLGKLLFRVPSVGKYLSWFADPLHLALTIGAIFLLFSDRRERPVASPAAPAPSGGAPPLVVKIKALRLPQELPTADLEDGADLEKLAQLHGIAILRDATADYLLQGGLLYRYVREGAAQAPMPQRRRPGAHGRDWDYARGDVVQLADRRAVS